MSISLRKGGSLNLSKENPTVRKIMVGLGWDKGTKNLDLDCSAFVLGPNGKLLGDEYFVFYNNLKSPDGALQLTGDNRTGDGDGDDEMILVNLDLIHQDATEILFIVTIHESNLSNSHFGVVQNAFIRIYDVESKKEILKYFLDEERTGFSDFEFGKLSKQNEEWKFTALGNGSKKGLQGFINIYA